MNVTIFIVSHKKDFAYLRWCLKSIAKFATGFYEARIVVPHGDLAALAPLLAEWDCSIPLSVVTGHEWRDKPFLWHEMKILYADLECPNADFILHTDSDCIFIEPVSPADYFVNRKPVLMHGSYEWLGTHVEPGVLYWKVATENAIGGTVTDETMRRHPAVHYKQLYGLTRAAIESHTKTNTAEFIHRQQDAHPSGFAEFPTLGAVAWRTMRSDYHWVNQQTDPPLKSKQRQFWTKGPLDKPQEVWFEGRKVTVVPMQVIDEVLNDRPAVDAFDRLELA